MLLKHQDLLWTGIECLKVGAGCRSAVKRGLAEMAKPRECRKLTGSPDRKAQKKALRKSVLTAFVSDAMQYILSSGVHCTHQAISLVWWMACLLSQPTQHCAKLASMRVSMEQLNRLTSQSVQA